MRDITIATIGWMFFYIVLHLIWKGTESKSLDTNQIDFILELKAGLSQVDSSDRSSLIKKQIELIDQYLKSCDQNINFSECCLSAYTHIDSNSALREYLGCVSYEEASFFWLSSGLAFLEVLLWSIAGVLCSLLFHGTEAIRNGNFDPSEVSVHKAKLLYSPIVTLVIVLSGNVAINNGDLNPDDSSYWLIVVSFILGFYSRRAIDLLDRIKDVFFRSSVPPASNQKPIEGDNLAMALESNREVLEGLENVNSVYIGYDYRQTPAIESIFIELINEDDSKIDVPLTYEKGGKTYSVPTVIVKNVKPSEASIGMGDPVANSNNSSYQGTTGCIIQNPAGDFQLISCAHVLSGGVYDPLTYVGELQNPDAVTDGVGDIGQFVFGFQSLDYDFGVASIDNQASAEKSGLNADPIEVSQLVGPTTLHFKGLKNQGSGSLIATNQEDEILFGGQYFPMRGLIKVAEVVGGDFFSISTKGDSGSVLYDDSGSAVAMIVSSNTQFTFAFPIAPILKHYNLKIH